MEFLRELLDTQDVAKATRVNEALLEKYNRIKVKLQEHKLTEGFIEDHNGPLEAEMDQAARRFEVVRNAIGLVNKLPAGESKTRNKKRMWGHLNNIRNTLNKIMKQLEMNDEQRSLTRDAGRERVERERQLR